MSPLAARLAHASLLDRRIDLRFGHRYVGAERGAARFEAHPAVNADLVIVATGARPPQWLGLAAARDTVSVAADGGLAIRSDLRSASHPAVFAAGDCATFIDQSVPKSGVHALRQGPVLARNLARGLCAANGGAPASALAVAAERFAPRRWTLALLNRCDGSAIGAWGPLGFAGEWAWRWKDRIDRRFMARFDQDDEAPGDTAV
ncbi:MAG: FAD-dependent oxidoreductase [Burkholderiaceae bacterium]|nr:FAD-dependent oxidoreductase [Burkholderiaceae bacterium]